MPSPPLPVSDRQREERADALIASIAETGKRPRKCEECENEFVPQRADARFCCGRCRARHGKTRKAREDKELDPIRSALEHLGREERDQKPPRLTGQARECRCNGTGVFDFDEDGDSFCRRCGGPVEDVDPNPSRRLNPKVMHLMKEPWK